MDKKFMDNFIYNETKVNEGIETAISHEKNSSPRYNPFFLYKETPELDAAIERDLKEQAMRKSLRSLD